MGAHPYDYQPLWPLNAVLVALRVPQCRHVHIPGHLHLLSGPVVRGHHAPTPCHGVREKFARGIACPNAGLGASSPVLAEIRDLEVRMGEPRDEAAVDLEDWKRTRSESSTAADELDSTYMSNAVCMDPHHYMPHRMEVALRGPHSLLMSSDRMKPRSGDWAIAIDFLQEATTNPLSSGSNGYTPPQYRPHFTRSSGEASGGCEVEGVNYQLTRSRPFTWRWVREWCVAWWHSGREDDAADVDYEDTPSDMGYATPVSVETPLQSSVSRCTSLNVIRDPYASGLSQQQTPTRHLQHYDARSLPASGRLAARSVSSDSEVEVLEAEVEGYER
uniref:Uncharacterized protein n=1 Tax=Timema cristinae TaxID=61476 RepID=A0A7R9GR49_TIMCR|nr:unnamed protein product [Timema cristinae]